MSEAEPKYDITIIHAEDDYDIPWSHSDRIFWHAVSATRTDRIGFDEFETERERMKKSLGAAGWIASHESTRGAIRRDSADQHPKLRPSSPVRFPVFFSAKLFAPTRVQHNSKQTPKTRGTLRRSLREAKV